MVLAITADTPLHGLFLHHAHTRCEIIPNNISSRIDLQLREYVVMGSFFSDAHGAVTENSSAYYGFASLRSLNLNCVASV